MSIQTGYLVEGKGAKSCTITYLAQVDPKGEGGDTPIIPPRGAQTGWVGAGRADLGSGVGESGQRGAGVVLVILVPVGALG